MNYSYKENSDFTEYGKIESLIDVLIFKYCNSKFNKIFEKLLKSDKFVNSVVIVSSIVGVWVVA